MKNDLKEAFGATIKSLREENGITQQELADYCELDRTYISDLERGRYYPSLLVVYKLSEVLRIKPHVLIRRVDKLVF